MIKSSKCSEKLFLYEGAKDYLILSSSGFSTTAVARNYSRILEPTRAVASLQIWQQIRTQHHRKPLFWLFDRPERFRIDLPGNGAFWHHTNLYGGSIGQRSQLSLDRKTNNGFGICLVENGGNLYFGGLNRSWVLSLALHFSMGFPQGGPKPQQRHWKNVLRLQFVLVCPTQPTVLISSSSACSCSSWPLRTLPTSYGQISYKFPTNFLQIDYFLVSEGVWTREIVWRKSRIPKKFSWPPIEGGGG